MHERLEEAMVGDSDDSTEALFNPYCSETLDQVFDITTDTSWAYHWVWARIVGTPFDVVLRHASDMAIVLNATITQPEMGLPTRVLVLVPPSDPRPIPLSKSTPVPLRSSTSSPLSSPSRTPKYGSTLSPIRHAVAHPDHVRVSERELRLGHNWALIARGSGDDDEGLRIQVNNGGRLLLRTIHPPQMGIAMEPVPGVDGPAWTFARREGSLVVAVAGWCPSVERVDCDLRSRIAIALDRRMERRRFQFQTRRLQCVPSVFAPLLLSQLQASAMMPHDNEAFAQTVSDIVFERLPDDHHRYVANWVESVTRARMPASFLGFAPDRLFVIFTPDHLFRMTRFGGGDGGQRAPGLPEPWRLRQCHLKQEQVQAMEQAIERGQSWEVLLADFLNVAGSSGWRPDGSVKLE